MLSYLEIDEPRISLDLSEEVSIDEVMVSLDTGDSPVSFGVHLFLLGSTSLQFTAFLE